MTDLLDRLKAELNDRYDIQRELGGGGMSRVFLAEERALGRAVVIKVLAPQLAEGISSERFGREVRLAARLQHPQIVPVLSAGEVAGLPYYTMPYVAGESLRAVLRPESSLPVAQVVSVVRDVAKALDYAHGEGVVHRDIKPENVLLSRQSAAVTDFGIAKALSESRADSEDGALTQLGMSLGTPLYMAPEQAAADPGVDHRADIYSLGILAYEMLAGSVPFHSRPVHQVLAAHISERPVPLAELRADVPPAFAELVMRCLEKDPSARPQSAAELLEELEAAVTGSRSAATLPKSSRTARIASVAVLLLIVVAGIVVGGRQFRSVAEPPSVAVLPLRNVGGGEEDAWFADGLTDELTVALQQLPGLRVASRNAVFSLAGRVPHDSIGPRLGVGSVLTGTIRRDAGRIRLTAELTRVPSGEVLWSDRYERSASDVFAVQDDVTRSIVGALRVQLMPGDAPAALRGTNDLEAYDLYLRGRTQFQARGEESMRRAAEHFERAAERDPGFARAWAGLAMVVSQLPYWANVPLDSVVAIARPAAERAIELDPSLAEPWAVLGFLHRYGWNWPASEEAFRRALQNDPRNVTVLQWYGEVLLGLGRVTDAVEVTRRAHEADPHDVTAMATYGYALAFAGRAEEALDITGRAVAMEPGHGVARVTQATALHVAGRHPEAADAARVGAQAIPTLLAITFATYYQAVNEPQLVRDRFPVVRRELGRSGDAHTSLAVLHLALGEDEDAVRELVTALDRQESGVMALSLASPIFDPVRGHPDLLRAAERAGIRLEVPRRPAPRM